MNQVDYIVEMIMNSFDSRFYEFTCAYSCVMGDDVLWQKQQFKYIFFLNQTKQANTFLALNKTVLYGLKPTNTQCSRFKRF